MQDFFTEIQAGLSGKRIGIEEFCESSDFCSKRLYPRQKLLLKLIFLEELTGQEEDVLTYWLDGGRNGNEIVISPMIRERMDTLREMGYNHFREVVLVGGRRSSKGYVTGLTMAKKLWDTLQLQDPGLYYGIDPDKEIYFSCIAASQDQAKKYQYADFSSTIARCEAMQKNITKIQELEFSVATGADLTRMNRWKRQGGKVGRDISKLRGIALAANASTVRGSATMCAVFDEMAFMQQEGESAQTASSVYDALLPSLAQFRKDALIMCNSSPYTKIGKFYERFEDSLRIQDGKPVSPLSFALQFPSWALFEGYQDDPERRFRNAITVSPDWNPLEKNSKDELLHSPDDRDAIVIARDEERQDPDTYKVERRGRFAEIVDAFLRPEMIDRAYLGRPTSVADEFIGLKTNWNNSSFLYKYKAHLDPSSTTAGFGFSLGHVEDLIEPDGRTRQHVIIDIIKRWKPDQFPEGVVDWEVVLEEMTRYINIFEPYEITFDQFQSSAPIQWLNKWLREQNMSHIRVYEKTAPQPLSAGILTPTGWTTMGELKMGDSVIGSDGYPRSIIGLYPKGVRKIYRVRFSDGAETECTEDHLWTVRKGRRTSYENRTLREMMDLGLRYPSSLSRWAIPKVDPIRYAEGDPLPLDPYLLGVFLGDGSLGPHANIACSLACVEEQTHLLKKVLPEGAKIRWETCHDARGYKWGKIVITKVSGKTNPVLAILRELGLYGCRGKEKFIPEIYLRAKIEDRISLLQGLMDSDGASRPINGNYRALFSNRSEHLIEGMRDLVGGLGGGAKVGRYGGATPEVRISGLPLEIVPFRLTSKAHAYRPTRPMDHRFITSIEETGCVETQCISVDSDDHLYVTDDFILTHNTAQYNWNRAEVFRTALYQGLVHCPLDTVDAEWSAQELKHLQQINTAGRFPRVDKQDIGPVQTKDMADAIMEVTEALIGNVIANQMRSNLGSIEPQLGAAGGYQIGGRNDQMDSFYFSSKGSNTFREMRKGATSGPGGGGNAAREQLNKLAASRSGSWNARLGRSGVRNRGRGF